jgi:uncharacterized protein YfaQ (DUF2300 family)
VHRRTTPLFVAALLLLPIVAGSGLMSVVQAALATSCCAATDYTCAGLRAPDDCCKKMGHTAGAATAATIERAAHAAQAQPVIFVASPLSAPVPASFDTISAPAGPRLHDPPHLHTFALLI